MKLNGECANLTMFFLYTTWCTLNKFWHLFLGKVYLKMNDNSSRGKMCFIQFHSVNA